MKKVLLPFAILLTGILLTLPACDDNNGRSLDDIYISLATVVPEGGNTFSFLLDDGTRLRPSAGMAGYPFNSGERAFLNYTILWESPGDDYDYDIKVNEIWNILTKRAIELNAANADSIGNDPVRIKELWIGGDYLNVSFLFNYGGVKPHAINLVNNTLSSAAPNDAIALEFRHNAYNSSQTRLQEGFVCFDLKPFRDDNADEVKFSIKVKQWTGETTYDVTYKYNQPSEEASLNRGTPVIASDEYY